MTAARFPTPEERARRAQLLEMLDAGKVLVQLTPRHPGTDLPEHLRDEMAVGLALSRRFALPVMELGPLEIRASLSFGGERYLCVVPWMAVFSLKSYVDETHVFYPESVPPELIAGLEMARRVAEDAPAPPASTPPAEEPVVTPARPALTLIKS